MNQNPKFYLQPAGVNDGLIVVDGTKHVFDIAILPKTLEEWKEEYTYRQFQVIAKHHLSICARTMKDMSLPTRVVEEWKRSKQLVMKDPACRNLFAPSVPVNASTKSPGDQSKSASSIVIASKPKPEPSQPEQVEKESLWVTGWATMKRMEVLSQEARKRVKELERMKEEGKLMHAEQERTSKRLAKLERRCRIDHQRQKTPLSKVGKEVRNRKENPTRVETAPVASKMKQKILKKVQVGMLADDANLDLLMHIQDEVEKDGSRLHKEIVFNASLPESERLTSAELYIIIEKIANKSLI